MKIKVFGTGCKNCKQLHELAVRAVKELGLAVEVEYISEVQAMLDLGVMAGPVLVINDNIASVGQVPSLEKIKQFIADSKVAAAPVKEELKKSSSCGCGSCGCKN